VQLGTPLLQFNDETIQQSCDSQVVLRSFLVPALSRTDPFAYFRVRRPLFISFSISSVLIEPTD